MINFLFLQYWPTWLRHMPSMLRASHAPWAKSYGWAHLQCTWYICVVIDVCLQIFLAQYLYCNSLIYIYINININIYIRVYSCTHTQRFNMSGSQHRILRIHHTAPRTASGSRTCAVWFSKPRLWGTESSEEKVLKNQRSIKHPCCKEAAFFVSVFFLRGYLWISRVYTIWLFNIAMENHHF